jgi:hypothetical protein
VLWNPGINPKQSLLKIGAAFFYENNEKMFGMESGIKREFNFL